MDLGLAPRPLGVGATSAWVWLGVLAAPHPRPSPNGRFAWSILVEILERAAVDPIADENFPFS
jgi:hypothetical protein